MKTLIFVLSFAASSAFAAQDVSIDCTKADGEKIAFHIGPYQKEYLQFVVKPNKTVLYHKEMPGMPLAIGNIRVQSKNDKEIRAASERSNIERPSELILSVTPNNHHVYFNSQRNYIEGDAHGDFAVDIREGRGTYDVQKWDLLKTESTTLTNCQWHSTGTNNI